MARKIYVVQRELVLRQTYELEATNASEAADLVDQERHTPGIQMKKTGEELVSSRLIRSALKGDKV